MCGTNKIRSKPSICLVFYGQCAPGDVFEDCPHLDGKLCLCSMLCNEFIFTINVSWI